MHDINKTCRPVEKSAGFDQRFKVMKDMKIDRITPELAFQKTLSAPGLTGLNELLIVQKSTGNRTIQRMLDMVAEHSKGLIQRRKESASPSTNRTGLPDELKAGLECLSGFDLAPVRVHYNSDKPYQVSALAYTRGTDIFIGPGQEQHLPHEGWHVVQQMQGRVRPGFQLKGMDINDDAGLEREAEEMGKRVKHTNESGINRKQVDSHQGFNSPIIQGVWQKTERKFKFRLNGKKVKHYICREWDHSIEGKTWYFVNIGECYYFYINNDDGSISDVQTRDAWKFQLPVEISKNGPEFSGISCRESVCTSITSDVCMSFSDTCTEDIGECPYNLEKAWRLDDTTYYNEIMATINKGALTITDTVFEQLLYELQKSCTHYFFARKITNRPIIAAHILRQISAIQRHIVQISNEVGWLHQCIIGLVSGKMGSDESVSEDQTENCCTTSYSFDSDKILYELCDRIHHLSLHFNSETLNFKLNDFRNLCIQYFLPVDYAKESTAIKILKQMDTVESSIALNYMGIEKLMRYFFTSSSGNECMSICACEAQSDTTKFGSIKISDAVSTVDNSLRQGESYGELAEADLEAIKNSGIDVGLVEELLIIYKYLKHNHGIIISTTKEHDVSIYAGQLRFYLDQKLSTGSPNDPVHLSKIIHELTHCAEGYANFGGDFRGVGGQVVTSLGEQQNFKRYVAAAMNTGLENAKMLFEETERRLEAECKYLQSISAPKGDFFEYFQLRLNYLREMFWATNQWHEFPTVITEFYFLASQYHELRRTNFYQWLCELMRRALNSRHCRMPYGC